MKKFGEKMKTINKSYKIRIYPNKDIESRLYRNIGQVRFVFNQLKEIMDKDYHYLKSRGLQPKLVNRKYLNVRLNELKFNYKWLKGSDSTSLQAVFDVLIDSFIRFFKKLSGFPKYKSKKNPVQSFKLKNNSNSIRIEGNKIRLNKYGFVRFRDNRKIEGKILSATISLKNGKWYCSVNCKDVPITIKPKTSGVIGIDPNSKYLVLSNGLKIPNLKPAKKYLSRVKELSKSLSRKQKDSNNWYKAKKELTRIHDKIRNQRRDYTHKISYFIVTHFDQIAMENSNNKAINSFLNGHWNDNNSYELIRQLEYKSDWYGKEFVKVNPYNTSKTCHLCGHINEDLKLYDRNWVCQRCQAKHDRDVNAALNIEKIAFEGRNCPSGGVSRNISFELA